MPRARLPPRPSLRAVRGRAIQAQGGPEWNNLDVMWGKSDVTRIAGFYPTDLSQMGQGTGIGQHVGRKILMKELSWRGYAWIAPPGTSTATEYCHAIILDKQSNGGAGDGTTYGTKVFQSAESTVVGLRVLDYSDRFRVLHYRRYRIAHAAGYAVAATPVAFITGRIRLNVVATFLAGGSSQIATNNLFSLKGFDINYRTGTSCADAVSDRIWYRLRYTDA